MARSLSSCTQDFLQTLFRKQGPLLVLQRMILAGAWRVNRWGQGSKKELCALIHSLTAFHTAALYLGPACVPAPSFLELPGRADVHKPGHCQTLCSGSKGQEMRSPLWYWQQSVKKIFKLPWGQRGGSWAEVWGITSPKCECQKHCFEVVLE